MVILPHILLSLALCRPGRPHHCPSPSYATAQKTSAEMSLITHMHRYLNVCPADDSGCEGGLFVWSVCWVVRWVPLLRAPGCCFSVGYFDARILLGFCTYSVNYIFCVLLKWDKVCLLCCVSCLNWIRVRVDFICILLPFSRGVFTRLFWLIGFTERFLLWHGMWD